MVDAGIYEGTLLVVDRGLKAKHGDIIIASVDGEYTVKRLCTHPIMQLLPMNPDFPPIVLRNDGEALEILASSLSASTGSADVCPGRCEFILRQL